MRQHSSKSSSAREARREWTQTNHAAPRSPPEITAVASGGGAGSLFLLPVSLSRIRPPDAFNGLPQWEQDALRAQFPAPHALHSCDDDISVRASLLDVRVPAVRATAATPRSPALLGSRLVKPRQSPFGFYPLPGFRSLVSILEYHEPLCIHRGIHPVSTPADRGSKKRPIDAGTACRASGSPTVLRQQIRNGRTASGRGGVPGVGPGSRHRPCRTAS